MTKPSLMVTLWPSFGHFAQFANDERLSGIRLNSAMMLPTELPAELAIVQQTNVTVPLHFDVKGRQLRVTEVLPNDDHLDMRINHPITVQTPTELWFKAGADRAWLEHIEEDGTRLIFDGGPQWSVRPGESFHILRESLQVHGDLFTPAELEKIEIVREAGFSRYFLSYVESQADVDAFRALVGDEVEVRLKIENIKGLKYVANDFVKTPHTFLVAARGDLFVELGLPQNILAALKLIIGKDPEACVGSRLLLSLVKDEIPDCADMGELAWLYDIGYREMMLCDELCLKEDMLTNAVDAFEGFQEIYCASELDETTPKKRRRRGRLMHSKS